MKNDVVIKPTTDLFIAALYSTPQNELAIERRNDRYWTALGRQSNGAQSPDG